MLRLSLVCAAVLVSAPAAADDAAAWLLKVSDAARQANYQGVVVYRDGQRMDVMRLVHRQQHGQVQERLTSLTGKPRDILREGDRVAYYVGDEPVRSGEQQSLFPVLSQELLAQAATHYEFQDLGVARVAARPCRGVLMSPRDEFRYGYEICGDAVTGVPLRVTLLDRRGRTVEQLMFTEVAYPQHIADAAFTPPPGALAVGDRPAPAAPEAAAGAAATWQVATLPPGFRVVRRSLAPSPDGQGLVEHVLLSDGLSVVSVYGTRPGGREKAFRGLSNMGAMSAYGRRVGAFHITVIGEVPVSTVRMIGDGMTAPDAAPDSVEPGAERHEPESLTD